MSIAILFWPDFEEFTSNNFRALRRRWAVSPTRISYRAKVDKQVLADWEAGRRTDVTDEFLRAVYLALRDIVLAQARLTVSMLEAVTDTGRPRALAAAPIPARIEGGHWVPDTGSARPTDRAEHDRPSFMKELT